MAVQVRMPKLGMMEGDLQLVSWEKNEGDAVEKGDALAVVESQKITNEVEAPISGSILRIVTQVGETVPIGAVLAIIGEPGEDISALLPAAGAPVRAAESWRRKPWPKPCTARAGRRGRRYRQGIAGRKASGQEHGVSLNDVAAFIGSSRRLQGDDVLAFVEAGRRGRNAQIYRNKAFGHAQDHCGAHAVQFAGNGAGGADVLGGHHGPQKPAGPQKGRVRRKGYKAPLPSTTS